MRVVFMGTPGFACDGLNTLAKSGHEILAVVTAPDKKSGRGQKLSPCQVKLEAMKINLPVFAPDNLKDDQFIQDITAIGADIFIVIAFRILPKKLYSIPLLGSINIHGSLLPKYRGAAPINHAILNGEKETGLTSFFLNRKVDGGQIIDRERISIGENENFSSLYWRMAEISGPFLLKTLDKISQSGFKPEIQDNSDASPAPKISTEDCLIDWSKSETEVHNQIRAFSEKPGAYCEINGKKLKILESRIETGNELPELKPGEITCSKKTLYSGTAGAPLKILKLQPEGKKSIDALAFINGYMTSGNKRLQTTGRR